MCFNDYRNTVPHKGYQIIKSWKEKYFQKPDVIEAFKQHYLSEIASADIPSSIPGPFYVYTSNVDNHSLTAGFGAYELQEIHGTTEDWQCSKPCCKTIWRAPQGFRFTVDKETMMAPKHPVLVDGKEWKIEDTPDAFHQNNGFISNHPLCKFCGAPARPAILMFGDSDWVSNKEQGMQHISWERVMKKLVADKKFKVVILEIGCGKNVPTVRWNSEKLAKDLDTACQLIRVNPDFPLAAVKALSIKSKGLEAILMIDKFIQEEQEKLTLVKKTDEITEKLANM